MREQIVDEQPMETLHLYVVPEEPKPRREYPSIFIVILCSLIVIAIIVLSVFSVSPVHSVAFAIAVRGFALSPVTKTTTTTAIATGKGHTDATYATGMITFYNGAIYTQIIPIGTILVGSDGVSVITDAQAVIPPAAQTTPPTYGRTTVPAHALKAGFAGNIPAGDINLACCVTSVIAQNHYAFVGGKDARDFTYLTRQDVTHTITPLLPTLHSQALSLFPSSPILNPTCTTTTASTPSVGKETKSAILTMVETCKASSYSISTAKTAIVTYSKRFGFGVLTHIQLVVIRSSATNIMLYVTAQWKPIVISRFPNIGK
jgi:hypothetical protein